MWLARCREGVTEVAEGGTLVLPTDHLCVNVDGPSDDRAIKLDVGASVGVKARCCHSPGFYPGLRYHSFSTVGRFKVCVCVCVCVRVRVRLVSTCSLYMCHQNRGEWNLV